MNALTIFPTEEIVRSSYLLGGSYRTPWRTNSHFLGKNLETTEIELSCHSDQLLSCSKKRILQDHWIRKKLFPIHRIPLEINLKLFNEEEEKSSANLSEASETMNVSAGNFSSATLESWSVVYFAGYLVKNSADKFKCHDCRVISQREENSAEDKELLIFYKNTAIKTQGVWKHPQI